MSEITRKQVCKCEHCGNEAEMVVTCTLPDEEIPESSEQSQDPGATAKRRVKGHGTCTHCGNEADMWIDI